MLIYSLKNHVVIEMKKDWVGSDTNREEQEINMIEYPIRAFEEINEINKMVTEFSQKIAHEHHKSCDCVWSIQFQPAWDKRFVVYHRGYWLDHIWIEDDGLLSALLAFKKEFKKRMQREQDNYDFEKHCAKDADSSII